jgi:hypothetical protein
MKVGIFDQYGALNSPPVFAAIRAGLDRLGISHTSMHSGADVAVIWSVLWHGRMRENQRIWNLFRTSGRPVIVAEVGAIQRGLTWKLGLNGTWQGCYPGAVTPGRAAQLRMHTRPWRARGTNVVIAVQRSDSEQWAGQPPTVAWLTETAAALRQHTGRPLIIRPHPRQRISNIPGCWIQSPQPVPGTYDGFDYDRCLQDAWAVINWNSGPGIQAILSGVPAFVGANSLAAPVANLDLSQIEHPAMPDRESWLEHMAHTEWTIPELETGEPVLRLLTEAS